MNVKISLLQIPRDLQLILQSSWLSAFIAVMPDRSSVNSSSNEIAPEESLIDRVYPSGLSIKVPFSTIFNYCLGTLTGTSSITGVTSQQSVSISSISSSVKGIHFESKNRSLLSSSFTRTLNFVIGYSVIWSP
jgi:hypothetical protein